MVKIAPFKAYTYNLKNLNENGSKLVIPPYDVITKKMQKDFLNKHPHNFINLDYAEKLETDETEFQWHERAGELLNKWIKEGVLEKTKKPAIYIMETTYYNPETKKQAHRTGFVCLLKLEELTKNSFVKPHEQTFSSHKIERLSLTKHTAANLSQVFGFFSDNDEEILNLIKAEKNNKEDVNFVDEENLRHKIWIITQNNFIENLQQMLISKIVYIADGHHRYITGLNYKSYIRENNKVNENSLVDYLMVYLTPMSDPGLCILPTHRLLNYKDDNLIEKLEVFFNIKVYEEKDKQEAFKNLKLTKNTAYLIYMNEIFYLAELKDNLKLKSEDPAELSSLDVYRLSNLIFKEIMNFSEDFFDKPDSITYHSNILEALENCKKNKNSTAFFLKATTVEDILKVCEINRVMPRKSTYFYPKVTTGLLVNKIDYKEEV